MIMIIVIMIIAIVIIATIVSIVILISIFIITGRLFRRPVRRHFVRMSRAKRLLWSKSVEEFIGF